MNFLKSIMDSPRTKVLETDEEIRLAREYQAGHRQSGNRLVEANLRIIVQMANKYANSRTAADELFQEGSIGFLRALDSYDPARGYRFSTYGLWWAMAYMRRYMASNRSVVYSPKNRDKVETQSLDAMGFQDAANLVSDEGSTPAEALEVQEFESQIHDCLSRLDVKDRRVLLRLFWDEDVTLSVLGEEEGVTREAVRQRREKGFRRLRKAIEEETWIFSR